MASYSIKSMDGEAERRYLSKLRMIEIDICPYLIPADLWKNDPTCWPSLEWPEVYTYLVETPGVFTREAMKNRKSLEAYNQFISGWVRTINAYKKNDRSQFMVLKAEVTPSQRLNEKPHEAWVALSTNEATVVTAHCSCMAGLGESCSHIAALLFKVEAAVRSGFTRRACTEEACKWNVDFMKKIEPAEISRIQFYSQATVDRYAANSRKRPATAFPGMNIEDTKNEQHEFLQRLQQQESKAVVLHAYSEYCDSFVPTYYPPKRGRMPVNLRDFYAAENAKKSKTELKLLGEKLLNSMIVTEADIEYVENITRRQSNSILWHQVRTGRITASKAHLVLHTSFENPAHSVLKEICKKSAITVPSVPALNWGIVNEKNALREYEFDLATKHESFEVCPSGFVICREMPFLGASPDGIFKCKCHNITKLVEVKCPYSKKLTKSVDEAIKDPSFCLSEDKKLKTGHKYYTQVQMQLHICQEKECDFVVWTPNWCFWTTVYLDVEFIKSSVPVLSNFYHCCVVPELLTREIEESSSENGFKPRDEKLYCYCQSKEAANNERWIGCDSANCKYEWFHMSCVKMKRVPKKSWYCPECRKQK